MSLWTGFVWIILSLVTTLFSLAINSTWWLHYSLARFVYSAPANNSAFDYIVVGSGTTGSVVAGRLAEAGEKVLLLEAGGPGISIQQIPLFGINFLREPLYDWDFEMKRKEGIAGGAINRTSRCPRGLGLGGSSMLNWMHYFRGHSADYDEWEQLGNPGWSYKDVLPFFKSAERFHGGGDEQGLYGTKGKFGIQRALHRHPIHAVVLNAFRSLGLPIGEVHGKEESNGIWKENVAALTNGWRRGTYKSFVEPIQATADIEVLTFALASKILVDEGSKSARGVRIERFGQSFDFMANKEVIVSGGSIGSPQILMLSGIGPKHELKKHKIRVVKDLPVGSNLQDHCLILSPFRINKPDGLMIASPLSPLNPINVLDFLRNGRGPLANTNLAVNGVFHTPSNKGNKRPDVQIHMGPFDFSTDMGVVLQTKFNLNDTMLTHLFGLDHIGGQGIGIAPTLLHPKSRGSVTLSGPAIHDAPVIDTNFLDHPDDLRSLVEGLKFLKTLEKTPEFKKYDIRMPPERLFCKDYELFSDAYMECFVKEYVATVFHPSGTCAMGPRNRKDSVVDHRLRVHGISNLRVADASIMPRLVGANTNAACVMIGEKAANMILEDSKASKQREKKKKKADRTKEEL